MSDKGRGRGRERGIERERKIDCWIAGEETECAEAVTSLVSLPSHQTSVQKAPSLDAQVRLAEAMVGYSARRWVQPDDAECKTFRTGNG